MPTFRAELGGQDAQTVAGIFSEPAHDLAALLPPRARQRYEALQLRASDARKLIPDFTLVREAGEARLAAEKELEKLRGHPNRGGFDINDPDDPRLIAVERKLAAAADRANKLTKLQRERSAASRAVGNVLHVVESWLRSGMPSGVALADLDHPDPELRKDESLLDALARLERRGRELRADLARIDAAPVPSAVVRANVRQIVEGLAQRGAPSVTNMIEHGRSDPEWPTTLTRVNVQNIDNAPAAVVVEHRVDMLGLLAFVCGPQLLARLDELITEESDDPAALTSEEREKQAAVVHGDLLACQRDIAAVIWSLQSQGQRIEFTIDLDARAVLGLTLVVAPPSQRGTSAEHAFTVKGPRR